MSNKIITISREFGSGGRTIGRKLAEKLNLPCYDSELIEKIEKESGFAKEYIAEHGEYAASGWLAQAFMYRDRQGRSLQDDLWIVQQKVILDIAQQGPCVIVGRCADYILSDKFDCLKVFICSDMQSRAKRIVEQYGERSEAPERRLKEKDKRRATYYQFYTDLKWGDAHNYHLTLNSGELGIDKCVELIASLYKSGDN